MRGFGSPKIRCGSRTPEKPDLLRQPAFNSGDFASARKVIASTIKAFSENDYPIVVPSASCAAMLFHSAKIAFRDQPQAERDAVDAFAKRVWEFCDYLVNALGVEKIGGHLDAKIAVHNSCHGRGSGTPAALRQAARIDRRGENSRLRKFRLMLRLRRNVLRGVPANFVRNGACESAGNQRGKSRPRGGGGYFVPAPSKGNRRQEQHQIPRPTRGARSLYRRWEETNNGSPTHRQILRNARPCGQKRGDACKRGKHGLRGRKSSTRHTPKRAKQNICASLQTK